MSYTTVITNAGLAALAAAQSGGIAVTISDIGYGDGNGATIVPNPAQTTLTHEVHRRAINGISTDPIHPEWVVIESTIPPDIGGFTVREVGVVLTDGTLFAVASYPEVYKPTVLESAGRDLYVKMILSVGNAANVTLNIDVNTVTATIDYVDQKIVGHEAVADPHPQYLTQQEGNILYSRFNAKNYFIGGF